MKGTSFKTKYNIYQVALKSCGGTKGKMYKTVNNSDADLLFIATKNRDFYLIPIRELTNTYTLNLGQEYNKYKLNF